MICNIYTRKALCCKYGKLILISAGIHHIVLDQNLVSLTSNLIPDEIISRMLQKDSSWEKYVMSAEKEEDRIQRFTECLQNSSLEDYKYFIKLLYETKQELLITKLVTSCKISLLCLALWFKVFLQCKFITQCDNFHDLYNLKFHIN